MASLKDVKVKIGGVKKTKQITKAMNMVASAKLRGAQQRIERFRPYAEKFYDILGHLAGQSEDISHPLLQVHKTQERILIVLITSDRGLCGSLNASLIARALDVARKYKAEGKTVEFACVGKKGRDAIRKSVYEVKKFYTDDIAGFGYALAGQVGREVISDYRTLAADEVLIIYPEFKNVGSQVPMTLSLLPITARKPAHVDELQGELKEARLHGGHAPDFLYEPAGTHLLEQLLPTYINAQIYRALLDAAASENAARMMAMDNATRNCDDMISALTLLYNKTRQASITSELIDIVGGAEAL